MTDRTSYLEVGGFILCTDRDHRGRFRGSQAMSTRFRGWHYHIEHSKISQEDIFRYLSGALDRMGAVQVSEMPFIGVVEAAPQLQECWRLGDASTVLWISSVTGGLHVEANKKDEYAKSILTKPALIYLLKNYTSVSQGEQLVLEGYL